MDRVINIALILLISAIMMVLILLYIRKNNKRNNSIEKYLENDEKYHLRNVIEYVKSTINEMIRTNLYELGLEPEEIKKRLYKRSELKNALKNCTYGSTEDKAFIKDYIFDLLHKNYINEESINKVIHFNQPSRLTIQDKFEIILYYYKKQYNNDALKKIIEKYSLDQAKYIIEEKSTYSYIITKEEIEDIYNKEYISLSYIDKLNIIVQRVYQNYKGYGIVDEIRDMNIDGVSGGVSGNWRESVHKESNSLNSVWIFYKGKTIHLSFLGFENENELRRICQNIYRYNKAGQLSEINGYKINELKDGSRVVVVRPTFSESWAFFVRKFHLEKVELEELIKDKNAPVVIELIKFLVKGCRITSITGSQGSGKTTLLMAMVKHIYGTLTLRIQETSFELNLRNLYPMRNILTFRETQYISGQEGLDLQKKTDGSVNILGEVATDEVAAWMIQMAQVASLFTLFTHHAKKVDDLIMALRNSLLKCNVFNNEKIAEQQVVQVLNFDIHLERDYSGKRYIERITEIIPIEQDLPYPDNYRDDNNDIVPTKFLDTAREYFTRVTDRKQFKHVNIIEYRDGQYIVTNRLSNASIVAMEKSMTEEDRQRFRDYIISTWGDKDN